MKKDPKCEAKLRGANRDADESVGKWKSHLEKVINSSAGGSGFERHESMFNSLSVTCQLEIGCIGFKLFCLSLLLQS